jgi:hypothetical protein
MTKYDLNSATSSDMTNRITDVTVDVKSVEGVGDQEETTWTNSNWTKYWGYFNSVPELKSAFIMKSIWNVGKGFEADPETKVILDHISGWGKDTFEDILFNMDLISRVGGDSFAEIIRDPGTNTILNLKPLDPGSIRIVVNRKGIIKRYEQLTKTSVKNEVTKFEPDEILHFSHNRFADQIHGISDIESMEKTVLAEYENFTDMKQLMHRQVKPFILWKLKTDDTAKISECVRKIDYARNLGEDMFIPDDDDAISYEIVQVNVSASIMAWRDDIRNKFYRTMGLPLIIFGTAGSTESGGKIEYLAHEQVFEKDQRFIENQIWQQLYLRINLLSPVSLLENLQTDAGKDGAAQQMNMQQSDVTAGAGK